MPRIIAFDVETPNRRNDRICSIGITMIDDAEITETLYFLVNPECGFDDINIGIHGIYPGDVADAPTFPEIWPEISGLFRASLVAAHNANFDLCVLKKTLAYYEIHETILYYVCTKEIAHAERIEVENYKLPTLCNFYGISLNHHNAASDSEACASILCNYIMEGIDLNRYTKSYSLVCSDEPERGINPRKPQFSANTQSLLMLNGILEGITCDNVLTPEEINYLSRWMHANEALKGNYPYDKIFSILSDAMEDGVLEAHELAFMLEMFQQLADPVKDCGCSGEKLTLTGKTVCLSGEFDYGAKSSVSEKLVALGAYIHESVTKKTDYLLVGGQGSSAWAAGNYGTKIKKALELQGKGMEIVIIREADFFNALES